MHWVACAHPNLVLLRSARMGSDCGLFFVALNGPKNVCHPPRNKKKSNSEKHGPRVTTPALERRDTHRDCILKYACPRILLPCVVTWNETNVVSYEHGTRLAQYCINIRHTSHRIVKEYFRTCQAWAKARGPRRYKQNSTTPVGQTWGKAWTKARGPSLSQCT